MWENNENVFLLCKVIVWLEEWNRFLFALMWYVLCVVLLHYSHSKIMFSFQQINVCSWCSDLGNNTFNSRAPASYQSLSEVSALVFIFRKEIACEQAHLWVPGVSGKVWVSEGGVWCRKKINLPWSLISLVPRVSLSLFPRVRERP